MKGKKESVMHNNNSEKKTSALDIVQIGLMAALVYVSVAFVNIPIGQKSVLHFGDSTIIVAALLLGKKKGAIASAIGMCLFDVLSPYIIWAPFTFIIKGGMAYVVGAIAYRNNHKGKNIWNNLMGCILAGIWMIIGYYFAGSILYSSFVTPFADIMGNVIQAASGITIGLPLSMLLISYNKKLHFLK